MLTSLAVARRSNIDNISHFFPLRFPKQLKLGETLELVLFFSIFCYLNSYLENLPLILSSVILLKISQNLSANIWVLKQFSEEGSNVQYVSTFN